MTRSRELFTLTVLVIALGIAVGSARIFGVSMALGAFLAGMVVGRSDYSLRAASDALPMRDAFAVLFFVSVGILLDPGSLFDSPWLLAGSIAIVLVANPIIAFVIMWMRREPFKTGVMVAVALAQIGEFSFILADARPRPRPADARGDQHARGDVDVLDRRESGTVPHDRSDRAVDGAAAPPARPYRSAAPDRQRRAAAGDRAWRDTRTARC